MRWSKLKKLWFFRKKLEETEKQLHGHNENEKTPREKVMNFLLRRFFSFFRMQSIRRKDQGTMSLVG